MKTATKCRSVPRRWLWLIGLTASIALACDGEEAVIPVEPTGPSEDGPVGAETIDEFIAGLAAWPDPSPTSEAQSAVSDPDTTTQRGVRYICTERDVDLTQRFEDIVAVGINSGVLWPGAMVQGGTLRDGALAGIPLARFGIRLSIDLAVEQPSERVDNPTSATVQEAIAVLQRRADRRLGEAVDVLPARISFIRQEAFSLQQSMFAAKMNFKLTSDVAKASISGAFGSDRSFEAKTIVVRFFQPMYTITFADEDLPTPGSFFDSSVTVDDLREQEALGTIGRDNQPVYVKSVTYGRMMLFTMTSTTAESAEELSLAIDAAASVSGIDVSTDLQLTSRQKELLRESTYSMVALGGNSSDALAAIRSGDLTLYFDTVPPNIAQAVPLSYRINDLKNRRIAALQETTRYTVRTCTPQTAYRFQIVLQSIEEVSNCTGDTGSTRVASMVVDSEAANDPIKLFDVSVTDWDDIPGLPRTAYVNRNASTGLNFSITSSLSKGAATPSFSLSGAWIAQPVDFNVPVETPVDLRSLDSSRLDLVDFGDGTIGGSASTTIRLTSLNITNQCNYVVDGTRTATEDPSGINLDLVFTDGPVDCTGSAGIYRAEGLRNGVLDGSSKVFRVGYDTSGPDNDLEAVIYRREAAPPLIGGTERELESTFERPFDLPGGASSHPFSHLFGVPREDGQGQCSAEFSYAISREPVFLQWINGGWEYVPIAEEGG